MTNEKLVKMEFNENGHSVSVSYDNGISWIQVYEAEPSFARAVLTGFRNGIKRTFPVPIHNQIMPIGTFKSILKQASLTEEELKDYL